MLPVYTCFFSSSFYGCITFRDLSACVTLRRVPGGPDEELVDEWVEHHHLAPNEQEFSLRNKQVKDIVIMLRREQ